MGSRPVSKARVQYRKFCLVAPCLLVFSAFSAAQAGPKYNLSTEAKFKGTVEELKFPAKGNPKDVAHLMVKNGTDVLDVSLAPKSFIDDMGVTFAKGDEVALTGSKVKNGESDLILAREVVKGPDTLVLRDDKGNPVWNWRK